MPVIDMKGVWVASRNTQEAVHEVNRAGYQGAARTDAAKRVARKPAEKAE